MANRLEKVETVTDFLFLGSKITADSDCIEMTLHLRATPFPTPESSGEFTEGEPLPRGHRALLPLTAGAWGSGPFLGTLTQGSENGGPWSASTPLGELLLDATLGRGGRLAKSVCSQGLCSVGGAAGRHPPLASPCVSLHPCSREAAQARKLKIGRAHV